MKSTVNTPEWECPECDEMNNLNDTHEDDSYYIWHQDIEKPINVTCAHCGITGHVTILEDTYREVNVDFCNFDSETHDPNKKQNG